MELVDEYSGNGGNVMARAHCLAGALRTRVAHYRSYRTTLESLSRLSARELADIGIHRSEIRRIALQGADRI